MEDALALLKAAETQEDLRTSTHQMLSGLA
jgi:hypothetical protein